MGSMRKSRLRHYKQDRLTEHFISGSTARTMASLCGVNRKTAAFYFLQLREVIAYEQKDGSEALFGGEIEVDESYLVAGGKENAGAVLQTKSLYLVYSKEVKRFIPSLYRMLQRPL